MMHTITRAIELHNLIEFSPVHTASKLVLSRIIVRQHHVSIPGLCSLALIGSDPGWLALQRGATEAAEAARIFEGQLAGALVAEDGQLALSNLAASAAHGFMPKIQTQGQLGQARWRLVSAPSIPGMTPLTPPEVP